MSAFPTSDKPHSKISGGTIAAIVTAPVLLIVLVIIGLVFLVRRRSKGGKEVKKRKRELLDSLHVGQNVLDDETGDE
jgi:preprotein translocase subunit YajC